MKLLFGPLLFLWLAPTAFAADCRSPWPAELKTLQAVGNGDARSSAGICLVRNHLSEPTVAKFILRTIQDAKEDILLREDLILALAEAPLRKRERVETEPLVPDMDKQEKEAVGRTVAGAQSLLDLGQAVRDMDEIVSVTRYERDFFRALAEVALEDGSSVLLRAAAVNALEQLTKRVVGSGVYDMRNVRTAQETLRTLADRDDNASYVSGAATAYRRLAIAGLPSFVAEPKRALASEKPTSVKH